MNIFQTGHRLGARDLSIRGVVTFFVLTVLLTLASSSVMAGGTGGQVGEFLSYGAGARSLAMGAAFTSVADDASATYWNPAGLSQLTRMELTFLSATLFADTQYQFISFVKPSKKGGRAWGISMTKLANAGFERVTATVDNNTQTFTSVEETGTFGVEEQALAWSYGRKVIGGVSIGTSFKRITRAVDDSADSSMAADLASLVEMKQGRRRIGLTIRNVFSQTTGDTDDTLPLVVRVGISDQFFRKRLLLTTDIEKNVRKEMDFHFGGEFGFTRKFKGRFGVQGSPGEGLRETTVGFGYSLRSFTFDYAIGLHDELGTTSKISLSARFGRSVLERRQENVHQVVQKAYQAAESGNFLVVHEQLQAAQDIDPDNTKVEGLLSKFGRVIGAVPSATGNEENAVLTRQGVMSYINGDVKAAVGALRQAYYKDPRNEKLLALLNTIEEEAGMSKTETPRGPELFTPVDQKVFDARQAILEGKYDVAIKKCQDILDLDPKDVTALKIMGSAFFLLDDHGRARKLWSQVMALDPEDKEVSEFLKQLRPE